MEFKPKSTLSEDARGEFYILVEKYYELHDQWNNALVERINCKQWILHCPDYFYIHPDEMNDGIIQDFGYAVKKFDRLNAKVKNLAQKVSRIRAELIKLSE